MAPKWLVKTFRKGKAFGDLGPFEAPEAAIAAGNGALDATPRDKVVVQHVDHPEVHIEFSRMVEDANVKGADLRKQLAKKG
jgi:hypothetical protein